MYSIAIIENTSGIHSKISTLLSNAEHFDIVGKGNNSNELQQQLHKLIPDVIIFNGINCNQAKNKMLKEAIKKFKNIPVLLITNLDCGKYLKEYIRLGVSGIVFNNTCTEELLKAIKKLHSGEEYFNIEVWELLKTSLRSRKYIRKENTSLSEREITVLGLFCKGLKFKEIGSRLGISPRTVETHKKNILSKLNISTTAEMIKYAFLHKIL